MKQPLNDLGNFLNDISNKANNATKKLNSVKTVFDLLTPKFIKVHTKYDLYTDWLSSGGFDIADFENIPDQQLDDYVKQSTDFETWKDMYTAAEEEFIKNSLGGII